MSQLTSFLEKTTFQKAATRGSFSNEADLLNGSAVEKLKRQTGATGKYLDKEVGLKVVGVDHLVNVLGETTFGARVAERADNGGHGYLLMED